MVTLFFQETSFLRSAIDSEGPGPRPGPGPRAKHGPTLGLVNVSFCFFKPPAVRGRGGGRPPVMQRSPKQNSSNSIRRKQQVRWGRGGGPEAALRIAKQNKAKQTKQQLPWGRGGGGWCSDQRNVQQRTCLRILGSGALRMWGLVIRVVCGSGDLYKSGDW